VEAAVAVEAVVVEAVVVAVVEVVGDKTNH
jgi:hypothetical protein